MGPEKPEMSDQETQEEVRDSFLGEIETEIVGMQYHQNKILPGDQINLEREPNSPDDSRAIRVENGYHEPVGYLSPKMASWLVPLVDSRRIYLDGYVPKITVESGEGRCPAVLMVFQRENGYHMLKKTEPQSELEALHQTILQAYQNAQGYRNSELILRLAKGLRPVEKRELLPETRLLLALLPRMAHELRVEEVLPWIHRPTCCSITPPGFSEKER
jgi:hypothetical protein